MVSKEIKHVVLIYKVECPITKSLSLNIYFVESKQKKKTCNHSKGVDNCIDDVERVVL